MAQKAELVDYFVVKDEKNQLVFPVSDELRQPVESNFTNINLLPFRDLRNRSTMVKAVLKQGVLDGSEIGLVKVLLGRSV